MLELPNITLVAVSGLGYKVPENREALKKSCRDINFAVSKYLQYKEIVDIDSWNRHIIYNLPDYIETSHCLLVHPDGYVIHPELWNPEWLQYDYIGAPWPLPQDDYSYRSESGKIQRVGNSVSLRSKKLMDLVATREWKSYYGNTNEDGFICCHNREWLESQGCKFASFEVAIHFSKEHELPENAGIDTFCFHSL